MTGEALAINKAKEELLPWEADNIKLIDDWRRELKDLKEKGDDSAIQRLKTAVEAQLALADLTIKARQAGHAKLVIWLPTIFSLLGGILGALIGGLLKHG